MRAGAEDGSPHLARLAAGPRPTGSSAIAAARGYCAAELRRLGFVVREHSFTYSAFPGRFGAPAVGLVVAASASVSVWVHHAGLHAGTAWALALLGVSLAATVSLVRGVLDGPLMRRSGVNLEATRGARPRVWLVAHVDSKSQPVPMLLRVAGVVVMTLGLVLAAVAVAAGPSWSAAALVVTWAGAAPLLLSVAGTRSPGALDNASGVAAVLEAASLLAPDSPVGVLITDAEELALAGAAAWAAAAPDLRGGVALNCDSIDDRGALVAMFTRRRPDRLLGAFVAAASECGEPLRARRLVPGILTDSVALAAAGWDTVTLSRGSLRTLLRIHTRRDSLAALRGTGIPGAAQVLARTAAKLV